MESHGILTNIKGLSSLSRNQANAFADKVDKNTALFNPKKGFQDNQTLFCWSDPLKDEWDQGSEAPIQPTTVNVLSTSMFS